MCVPYGHFCVVPMLGKDNVSGMGPNIGMTYWRAMLLPLRSGTRGLWRAMRCGRLLSVAPVAEGSLRQRRRVRKDPEVAGLERSPSLVAISRSFDSLSNLPIQAGRVPPTYPLCTTHSSVLWGALG